MSTGPHGGSPIGRRGQLAGAVRVNGAVGAVDSPAAMPRAAAAVPVDGMASGAYPSNRPAPEPYGLADTRADPWPREHNSFVLRRRPRPPAPIVFVPRKGTP
ncbi:MAG: hypothetical protein HOY79_31830 [Streptomyces sp.]|nr:hypothetical protein [Streptomyces sp.]